MSLPSCVLQHFWPKYHFNCSYKLKSCSCEKFKKSTGPNKQEFDSFVFHTFFIDVTIFAQSTDDVTIPDIPLHNLNLKVNWMPENFLWICGKITLPLMCNASSNIDPKNWVFIGSTGMKKKMKGRGILTEYIRPEYSPVTEKMKKSTIWTFWKFKIEMNMKNTLILSIDSDTHLMTFLSTPWFCFCILFITVFYHPLFETLKILFKNAWKYRFTYTLENVQVKNERPWGILIDIRLLIAWIQSIFHKFILLVKTNADQYMKLWNTAYGFMMPIINIRCIYVEFLIERCSWKLMQYEIQLFITYIIRIFRRDDEPWTPILPILMPMSEHSYAPIIVLLLKKKMK